jgi:hypothetical protein
LRIQSTGMNAWVDRQKEGGNELHSVALPAPEDVHVGKRIRAALKNYWLLIENQRINLRILWVLRNQGSLLRRKQWQQALPQSAVLGKDNMDVDSMLHQSAPAVVKKLADTGSVVVELIPERVSFWTGNRPGVIKSPTSACTADFGFIAFTDIERGILFIADNHSPVNVSVLVQQLDRPDCVTYANGLLMFAETGQRKRLLCVDLAGKHVLAPDRMKVAQLRDACKELKLDSKGKKDELVRRLNKWLEDNKEHAAAPVLAHRGAEGVGAAQRAAEEREPWAKQRHKTRPAQPSYAVSVDGLDGNTVIRALLLDSTGSRLLMSTVVADNSSPLILEVALKFKGQAITGTITKTVYLELGNLLVGSLLLSFACRFHCAWVGMARTGFAVLRHVTFRRCVLIGSACGCALAISAHSQRHRSQLDCRAASFTCERRQEPFRHRSRTPSSASHWRGPQDRGCVWLWKRWNGQRGGP